jgi:hypothetical protein
MVTGSLPVSSPMGLPPLGVHEPPSVPVATNSAESGAVSSVTTHSSPGRSIVNPRLLQALF